MSEDPLQVMGVPGSPYTRKLLALLRYRRIPYQVIWRGVGEGQPPGYPKPKVDLLPTVFFRDGGDGLAAAIDTTPIIRRLETEREGRAALPQDPALRFLDALIEDFGDEWLTKAMFHYRWAYERDAENAARMLAFWADPSMAATTARDVGEMLKSRQIDRLYVVGSNPTTASTIEASYERLLTALAGMIEARPFLLGARPGAGDFALFGQLTQLLAVDPTPAAAADRIAPRLRAWIDHIEDLSGLEPRDEDWISRAEAAEALRPLLLEIGRVYAPFLLANAAAAQQGAKDFEAEIDGRPWAQPVFPYQVKCLAALHDAFAALDASDQEAVRGIAAGTGVEALLA